MAEKRAFAGDEILKKHLKEKKLSPVYVLFGEEGYLRRHYVQELISARVAGGDLEMNLRVFEGKDLSPDEVSSALQSLPFFGGGVAVLVKNPDPKALKGGLLALFSREIPEIAPEVTLIFSYEDPEHAFPGGAEEKKLAELVLKHGTVAELRHPSEKQMLDWVSRRLSAGGKSISPSAASYLLDSCGRSIDNLLNEMTKLLRGAKGSEIGKKEIDEICTKDDSAKIYKMTDLFLKNDLPAFIEELRILLAEKTEPVVLLASFARAIEGAEGALELSGRGMGAAEIARKTGQREFVVQNTLRAARGMKKERLKKILEGCVRTDLLLKSSRLPAEEVLQNFLTGCFFL